MKKKKCKKCKKKLKISSFYKWSHSKDKLSYLCKKCTQFQAKRVRKEKKLGIFISTVGKPRLNEKERIQRKIELRKYNKIYRKKNFHFLKIKKKEYNENLKKEGVAKYGGKCSCCGEKIYEFLTLEHINGRNKESGKRRTGKKAWMKVKAEGYPDKYTILCFNCNCAKGAYGICPHQKKK